MTNVKSAFIEGEENLAKRSNFPDNLNRALMEETKIKNDKINESDLELVPEILDTYFRDGWTIPIKTIKLQYKYKMSLSDICKIVGIKNDKISYVMMNGLKYILTILKYYVKDGKLTTEPPKLKDYTFEEFINFPVERFGLTTRPHNSLKRGNINFLKDFIALYTKRMDTNPYTIFTCPDEMNTMDLKYLNLRNIGIISYKEIYEKFDLENLGKLMSNDKKELEVQGVLEKTGWDTFASETLIDELGLPNHMVLLLHNRFGIKTVEDFVNACYVPNMHLQSLMDTEYISPGFSDEEYHLLYTACRLYVFKGSKTEMKLKSFDTELMYSKVNIKNTAFPYNLLCDVTCEEYSFYIKDNLHIDENYYKIIRAITAIYETKDVFTNLNCNGIYEDILKFIKLRYIDKLTLHEITIKMFEGENPPKYTFLKIICLMRNTLDLMRSLL